jgi:PAS domain-containing protein
MESMRSDLVLTLRDDFSDGYEMSQVLLARTRFDGTLELLTSGWERALGYARAELEGKTLCQLMWADRRGAKAAAQAILDQSNLEPVDLTLRCRDGLPKSLRLHRRFHRRDRMIYIVAEELAQPSRGAVSRAA